MDLASPKRGRILAAFSCSLSADAPCLLAGMACNDINNTEAGLRMQVCLGPGEATLVTGGYDQSVRVWDMRSRSFDAIQTIKSFADSVTSVAVSAKCAPSVMHAVQPPPSGSVLASIVKARAS